MGKVHERPVISISSSFPGNSANTSRRHFYPLNNGHISARAIEIFPKDSALSWFQLIKNKVTNKSRSRCVSRWTEKKTDPQSLVKWSFFNEAVLGKIYHFIMDYSRLEGPRFNCCDSKVRFISHCACNLVLSTKHTIIKKRQAWEIPNWMLYYLEVTIIFICNMFTPGKPRMHENKNPPSCAHLHASYLYVNLHLCFWKPQQGSEGGQRPYLFKWKHIFMQLFSLHRWHEKVITHLSPFDCDSQQRKMTTQLS